MNNDVASQEREVTMMLRHAFRTITYSCNPSLAFYLTWMHRELGVLHNRQIKPKAINLSA